MFDILKIRYKHGRQYIKDIKKASVIAPFRGYPEIKPDVRCGECRICVDSCPSGAISTGPFSIDMGLCVFCGDCEKGCGKNKISFTPYHDISSTSRDKLVVTENESSGDFTENSVIVRSKIRKIFGRSVRLREVSAGGCNGCEMELNACSNVNFDMGRYGIEFTASPKHADGIVITGPVSSNMADALRDTYDSVPTPRIIIAVGACAISGGIFRNSGSVNRSFFDFHKVDLFVPGCPAHPLTFIRGILRFLGTV